MLVRLSAACAVVLLLSAAVHAQLAQVPLTNADVLEMVKAGLPETTIVKSVQTSATSFDVSPASLIALHQDGVSQKIMDAMLAASSRPPARSPMLPPARTPAAAPAAAARSTPGPTSAAAAAPFAVTVGDQSLAVERTRLSQTAARAKSLGSLAKDRLMDEALRSGLNSAAAEAGSAVGRQVISHAGGIVGSMVSTAMKTQSKRMTYVWAVAGTASPTILPREPSTFDVTLAATSGVRADEYSPAIVRLTPAANGFRLIGATEGVADAASRSAVDWPVYSSFIEDRVRVAVTSAGPAAWRLAIAGPLEPGEYAVVLRPIAKNKQFRGQDVARNQGDGAVFNAVSSFALR